MHYLSPTQQAFLDAVFAKNRARFAGWRMEANTSTQEPEFDDPVPTPAPPPAASGEEALGDAGKKALSAERDARKKAEKQAAALQSKIDALQSENAGAVEEATKTAAEAVAAAEAAKAEALRYRIAAKYGISAEPGEDETPSDAEMFLTGSSEEELTAQAERLAAYRKQSLDAGLLDLTQGGGGQPAPIEPEPGVPRLAAAFDAQINK